MRPGSTTPRRTDVSRALDRLLDRGAAGAVNVRMLSTRPASVEAYATIGGGTRVRGGLDELGATSAQALPADAAFEGGTAAAVLARRAEHPPVGDIVMPSMPVVVRSAGEHLSSTPDALGEALGDAGQTTAVVSNADTVETDGTPVRYRPAAMAAMAAMAAVGGTGAVDAGTVEAGDRLRGDPAEPHGLRAAVDRYLTATTEALDCSDLVVVDLGDTNRAAWHARVSSRDATQSARRRALTRVDEFLGRLVGELDSDALLLVVGVRPPSRSWDLTPAVAYGAGVVPGSLHSPQTKREDLVTLTGVQALVYGVAAIALSQRAGRRVSSALRSPS